MELQKAHAFLWIVADSDPNSESPPLRSEDLAMFRKHVALEELAHPRGR